MNIDDFLANASIQWWDVLFAVAAVIVGWVLSRVARSSVRRLLRRVEGVPESLRETSARVCGLLVLILGFGVGLALLGANIQPLLAIVVVVAVVAALVLRGVAENFAAGVLIQTRRPIAVGDGVAVEGQDTVLTGTVIDLNARAVVLLTYDGRTVHVPNASFLQNLIVDDTTHGALRSEVLVRARRDGVELDELRSLVEDAVGSVAEVHDDGLRTLVTSVSPERVSLRVQFWHGPRAAPAVVSDVVTAVAAALASRGITATTTSDPPVAPLTPPDPV